MTNMPHAWMVDPGVYGEWTKDLTRRWNVSLGSRVDLVHTTARASDLRSDTNLPEDELTQDDVLVAGYLNNKIKLGDHWTLTAGAGEGQRPPTLIERYADGLFISSLQSGFTRVVGDPTLRPERDLQIDFGLSASYDRWRARANYFYAWVNDYITFYDDSVIGFESARLLHFMNTRLATLTGFEVSGEYDLSPWLTPFAKISYVEGQDQSLDAPLPMIPPLESTVGLRLHDSDKGSRWGIEIAARMVHTQNRPGVISLLGTPEVVEEATPGFVVWNLRSYYNVRKNFSIVAGIDNLLNRNYQEHLDLRLFGPTLPVQYPSSATRVLEPGISPYIGVNWIF